MGLRNVRELGDDILRKKSKPVKEMTPRLSALIDDMFETMYSADGVGLAAPQVGVLKRIVVMDVSGERDQPIVMINPEILETEGEQTGSEGCLSVPGKHAEVKRAQRVKVKALDRNMVPFELEGEDLLARCIQHETDHLEGIMYVDIKTGPLLDNGAEEEEEGEDGTDGPSDQ
ncbi:MAG: peptide deformylase [Lachnospiraceae bacterium]|nr:peptide deformylase [Lachnospiraceae bacterium]